MDFSRAKELLHTALSQRLFSGAALGLSREGSSLFTEYLGSTSFDIAAGQITPESLFDLASLTKTISTTMVTLRFLERGLIRLEDQVQDLLPESESCREITIRQLLTHTSGLPAHFLLEAEISDPAEISRHLTRRLPEREPGRKVVYSCIGFILLGKLLEAMSGKSLADCFHEEVSEPLGLGRAQFGPVDPDPFSVAATRDLRTGALLHGTIHDENARFHVPRQGSGNAGLFGNLQDCLTFASMLSLGGKHLGRQYLSTQTLAVATRNHTADLNEHRGLGFMMGSNRGTSFGDLCGDSAFGHTGFTGTSVLVLPELRTSVVLLTNRVLSNEDAKKMNRLRALIHNSVVAELSC